MKACDAKLQGLSLVEDIRIGQPAATQGVAFFEQKIKRGFTKNKPANPAKRGSAKEHYGKQTVRLTEDSL